MLWRPCTDDTVSFPSYCRFSSKADCEVPEVKVPQATPPAQAEVIGTENCVPLTTGINCVMGEANWNWKRTSFSQDRLNCAVSPSSSEKEIVSVVDLMVDAQQRQPPAIVSHEDSRLQRRCNGRTAVFRAVFAAAEKLRAAIASDRPGQRSRGLP